MALAPWWWVALQGCAGSSGSRQCRRSSRRSICSRPIGVGQGDRKSTRLNSSHANISYAVFCLKKKNKDLTSSAPESLYTLRLYASSLSLFASTLLRRPAGPHCLSRLPLLRRSYYPTHLTPRHD